MLSIKLGYMDDSYYGPGWFVNNYEEKWFEDPLVADMMKDIDKSEYRGGALIYSDVLGPISPRELSGGLKTLISIYKEPSIIFDATSCGENCARWLLEIGKRIDVTILLSYPMTFAGLEPVQIRILNTEEIVLSDSEYTLKALDILHEVNINEG